MRRCVEFDLPDPAAILPPKGKAAEKTVPTTVRLPVSLLADLELIAKATDYKRAEVMQRFLRAMADAYLSKSPKLKKTTR